MIVELASGWIVEVERGPDWLYVRLEEPAFSDSAAPLSDDLSALMEQEFAHRLIVELDGIDQLTVSLMDQLAELHERITSHGGLMRLCGLSDENRMILASSRWSDLFAQYDTRHEAVMGDRPQKPR